MLYRAAYYVLRPLVRRLTGSVTGTEHLPARSNFIVAGNHIGYMDAPVVALCLYERYGREPYFITLQEMWRVLGKRLARTMLGMIPEEHHRKAAVIDEAVATLRAGRPLGIFPEGKRNAEPTLAVGKTGAVRIALASGCPIIPVGIRNDAGRTAWQSIRSLRDSSRRVHLTFGPAVDLQRYRNRPIDKPLLVEATRTVMRAISGLCGKGYPY